MNWRNKVPSQVLEDEGHDRVLEGEDDADVEEKGQTPKKTTDAPAQAPPGGLPGEPPGLHHIAEGSRGNRLAICVPESSLAINFRAGFLGPREPLRSTGPARTSISLVSPWF